MGLAARAIIIEDNKVLVMYRNKGGSQYFTLIGGKVDEGESSEEALVREVREETGLEVIALQQVFTEDHPAPYNDQHIFVCDVAQHGDVAIQEMSEEDLLNKLGLNIHKPMWVDIGAFSQIAFRTPQLQQAIVDGLVNGFPPQPRKIS